MQPEGREGFKLPQPDTHPTQHADARNQCTRPTRSVPCNMRTERCPFTLLTCSKLFQYPTAARSQLLALVRYLSFHSRAFHQLPQHPNSTRSSNSVVVVVVWYPPANYTGPLLKAKRFPVSILLACIPIRLSLFPPFTSLTESARSLLSAPIAVVRIGERSVQETLQTRNIRKRKAAVYSTRPNSAGPSSSLPSPSLLTFQFYFSPPYDVRFRRALFFFSIPLSFPLLGCSRHNPGPSDGKRRNEGQHYNVTAA